jgi:uncharacterized protein (DUF2062 family)
MGNWFRRRLLDPLLSLLRRGMEPKRLALCVAIGMVVGNIPILGVSSILCTLIALVFRLNLPAIQIVQWAMAPTQLLLIIAYVRLGEWIMHAPRQVVSIKAGLDLMKQGVWAAVVVLKDAILHAGVAWLLLAPATTFLIYLILTPVFTRAAAISGRARGGDNDAGAAGPQGDAGAHGPNIDARSRPISPLSSSTAR